MTSTDSQSNFWKTFAIIMLILICAVGIWFLWANWSINNAMRSQGGISTEETGECEGPELASLNELLSKTSDPAARLLLQRKIQVAQQEAEACAQAQLSSPTKPNPEDAIIPTNLPGATATRWLGIHEAINPPQGLQAVNMWSGEVEGNIVEAYAGAIEDPLWQEHPDQPAQGAIILLINGKDQSQYTAPSADGALEIVAACENQLILHSEGGETFAFDLLSYAWTAVESETCP
jgi:hypothetical protein